jgi:branched-chain amino acid transport system permease protein
MYGAVAPLYVWFIRTVTPSLFTSEVTFVTWTALVIGGIASMRGPVIGALILLVVTEAAALVQGLGEMAVVLASVRFIILGIVLILVMRFRPEGLSSERDAFAGASGRLQR